MNPSTNTTRKPRGKTPALPTTADELLALVGKQITPALTKIHDAAQIAEKAFRTTGSVRTGFANTSAAEDAVASLCYFLDEAMKQVTKLGAARGDVRRGATTWTDAQRAEARRIREEIRQTGGAFHRGGDHGVFDRRMVELWQAADAAGVVELVRDLVRTEAP